MLGQMNDLSKNISTAAVTKTVRHLVRKVQLLQKTLSNPKSVSHVALEQQRQAMAELKNLATKDAVGVMGYVTACCITETNLNQLFDYRHTQIPNDEALQTFFEPQNFFPLLHKYNVLKKVDLPVFAADFPDLSEKPFSLALYDALNQENNGNMSFSDQLGALFKEQYFQLNPENPIDKRAQHRLQNVIEELAQKNYPSLQLLSAYIAGQTHNESFKQERLNAVLRNKYSTQKQTTYAVEALHLSRQKLSHQMQPSHFSKQLQQNR